MHVLCDANELMYKRGCLVHYYIILVFIFNRVQPLHFFNMQLLVLSIHFQATSSPPSIIHKWIEEELESVRQYIYIHDSRWGEGGGTGCYMKSITPLSIYNAQIVRPQQNKWAH